MIAGEGGSALHNGAAEMDDGVNFAAIAIVPRPLDTVAPDEF